MPNLDASGIPANCAWKLGLEIAWLTASHMVPPKGLAMPDMSSIPSSAAVRIAIAVKADGTQVSGHAGQTRDWLNFPCVPGQPIPPAQRITLTQQQRPHHFRDDGPHPLKDADVLVAGSAGDGFIRHMAKWGAQVLLTGETDPEAALARILAGDALPDTRFDISTTLCRLRDLFSRH